MPDGGDETGGVWRCCGREMTAEAATSVSQVGSVVYEIISRVVSSVSCLPCGGCGRVTRLSPHLLFHPKSPSVLIDWLRFQPRLAPPQWGAADAEIKVPSGENTELKRSPFKARSRSVVS